MFKVMRIKEMVTKERSFWLGKKFSLTAPWEMYKEQFREYAYWHWGVKGYRKLDMFILSLLGYMM